MSQPVINERYEILGESNSLFGSVIATDSCYYVAGVHTSSPSPRNVKATLLKFNFDGTINEYSSFESDTIGYDFWQGNCLIKTLDSNFAYYALSVGDNSQGAYTFVKLNPNGDTLLTSYHYDFYEVDYSLGRAPIDLIQNPDSSYYGLVNIQRETDLLIGVTFFKLNKYGELLYWKNYYGPSITGYHTISGDALIKLNDGELLIGGSLMKLFGQPNIDKRKHVKFIKIDVLGNILAEHTFWDENLGASCNGLTKTIDNGLIYCGTKGLYYPEFNGIRYKARIVKLNSDFEIDWELELGIYGGESAFDLYEIKALNDHEFVAVGWTASGENRTGWLVKFNLEGELIWERKYIKLPTHPINAPTHILYDIDITADSGFVMVGQSSNYNDEDYLMGQKGWLLKTDQYGCIVHNCHLLTVPIVLIDSADTTINPPPPPPKADPILVLYPNPTNSNLFYYHHQDNFQYGTAYIYSPTGEIVQKWEITENDITYDIDVSQLAAGTYFIKVFNLLGEPLQTERFVKL